MNKLGHKLYGRTSKLRGIAKIEKVAIQHKDKTKFDVLLPCRNENLMRPAIERSTSVKRVELVLQLETHIFPY